jgi:hypothetical protein
MMGRKILLRGLMVAAVFVALPTTAALGAIDVQPATATNTVGTAHTVTATVTNADDVPIEGEAVIFSVSGAHTRSATVATDANGQAQFSYTGTISGSDTITACQDRDGDGTCPEGGNGSSEGFDTATKLWQPATLNLTPESATNPIGTSHTVTATVLDENFNPMPKQSVLFFVEGVHTFSGEAITNDDGQASFTYEGTQTGFDQITACHELNLSGSCDTPNEAQDTSQKSWTQTFTLALTPETATNPVGTDHTVTATLTNELGPLSGEKILFTVGDANAASAEIFTDANGQAQFTYTGANPGEDTIFACHDDDQNGVCPNFVACDGESCPPPREAMDSATKTWTRVFALSLTPAQGTNPVGTDHTLTAALSEGGSPLGSGERILFTVSGANSTSSQVLTDASGRVQFTYVGPNAGQDTITACHDFDLSGTCDPGEATDTAVKNWVAVAPAPQCSDTLDNDGNGLIDFPADPGCLSAEDDREAPDPICSDGLDNDRDRRIDFPADPGCASALDQTEIVDNPPPSAGGGAGSSGTTGTIGPEGSGTTTATVQNGVLVIPASSSRKGRLRVAYTRVVRHRGRRYLVTRVNGRRKRARIRVRVTDRRGRARGYTRTVPTNRRVRVPEVAVTRGGTVRITILG